ncbi:unnamed protein product [Allacma fusca]|uniref:Uncharacterized protein n=1 Tax=Allacma fusca TaxID=39272 RepID=A0A8J2KJR9_9HEXA|nr:unnamed protein product [Allacma fusca]
MYAGLRCYVPEGRKKRAWKRRATFISRIKATREKKGLSRGSIRTQQRLKLELCTVYLSSNVKTYLRTVSYLRHLGRGTTGTKLKHNKTSPTWEFGRKMMLSVGSVATISSLWLAFLSTCCLAWPTPYRRSYQYYPPMMAELGPPNQWDIAQEPYSYEQPEDYFDNPQWADIEAISNLIDMYDNAPVWGQIVNEKPEEELIELKRSQPPAGTPFGQNQRLPQSFGQPAEILTSKTQVSTSAPAVPQHVSRQPPPAPQVALKNGQKEVALLRPPVKPKATPSPEPAVISAQVTSQERQKKPSPYDTLRKYLSIEDALKKEAEKRRADSRHQKRSNFVAEEGSLTGQLNNLKKNLA